MRIGNRRATRGQLMLRDTPSKRNQCNVDITVKHIEDCRTLGYARRRFKTATDLKEALSNEEHFLATIQRKIN